MEEDIEMQSMVFSPPPPPHFGKWPRKVTKRDRNAKK